MVQSLLLDIIRLFDVVKTDYQKGYIKAKDELNETEYANCDEYIKTTDRDCRKTVFKNEENVYRYCQGYIDGYEAKISIYQNYVNKKNRNFWVFKKWG